MTDTVKDNYWLKSGFINILQNISGVLFGVGGFMFLVRILPSHDYGIWVLFTTTTTIFSVVRDGMIRNALVKFLAGALEVDKAKIMSSALVNNPILCTT
jgi:O-antigen/teichoic acid export membrane protein